MTFSTNERARACFCKFLPAINKLRERCLYKKLEVAQCPEFCSEVTRWLADVEKIAGEAETFPALKSLVSQVSGEPNVRISSCAYLAPEAQTPESIFPAASARVADVRLNRRLYDIFVQSLDGIPESLRREWSLWLDHFDSAWSDIAVGIPAGKSNALEESVSLYDVSKAQAATPETDFVLLVQGDFQGIQSFIFTEGSETNKKSSKLLRGRSFYVSLISELAALKITETLKLAPLSPLMNAAGKFLVLAPYSEENIEKLSKLQKEIDEWFISNTLGTVSLVTSCTKVSREEVLGDRFDQVMKKVFEATESAKLRTFDLTKRKTSVLEVSFASGVSPYDQRMSADNELCKDEITIGDLLVKSDTLLISREKQNHLKSLTLPVFGYYVSLGCIQSLTNDDLRNAVRVWDISAPEQEKERLFKGLGRRFFGAYVSKFTYEGEESDPRYVLAKNDGEALGDVKPFTYLAYENTSLSGEGIVALASLKGDVDNLGMLFRDGVLTRFNASTCAAAMCLSRQVNNFFTIYLPVLFSQKYNNVYTVFAGGDDFFLIGPWHDIFELAGEVKSKFEAYCLNKSIHFSAGISVIKPNVPIRTVGRMTEESLDRAKTSGKNRVNAYGITVTWEEWDKLCEAERNLNFLRKSYDISTAYFYRLLDIVSLYEKKDIDPLANVWRSRLYYTTIRFVKDRNLNGETVKEDFLPFVVNSLEVFGRAFTIPLFNSLYTTRKTRN